MRARTFRILAVLLGVLILFSILISSTFAASMSARADKQDGCRWLITIEVSGMKPGSEVFLNLSSSNTRDCNGNSTSPNWSNWNHGAADDTGRKTMILEHGDYGRYTFTAHDNHGHQASTTIEYGYGGNQPQPTLLPTSALPATAEPVINHPTPGPSSPRAWGWADHQGGCDWNITLQIEGFAPNARDCNGNSNSPGWADWSHGNSDNFGRKTMIIQQGHYGQFNFTIRDSTGKQASVTVSYDSAGNASQPSQPSNNCASRINLSVGVIAVVTADDTRLRSNAGLNFSIRTTMPYAAQITMVGGPSCVDGHVWWESQYAGQSGWVSEANLIRNGDPMPSNGGSSGAESTLPPPPTWIPPQQGGSVCNSLSRLAIGDTASVSDATPEAVPMRTGPATSYNLIMQVAIREFVVVTGGPSCSETLVWWEVRKDGRSGWMAEINKFNNRNLIKVNPDDDGEQVDQEEENFVILSSCNANPLVEWWYQSPSDFLMVIPTVPKWADLTLTILDIIGVANKAQTPIPDEVEIRFLRSRASANDYLLVSEWIKDGVVINYKTWTNVQIRDNPCPSILAYQALR
jgi:uncharacterized protein YraI